MISQQLPDTIRELYQQVKIDTIRRLLSKDCSKTYLGSLQEMSIAAVRSYCT